MKRQLQCFAILLVLHSPVCGLSPINVVVVATGGTIAGSGANATSSATYTAAKIPVEQLLEVLPQIHELANVRGIQTMQIPS